MPFTYGPLAYLLKNRTYLGEMGYKSSWFPGEHKAILDKYTFDQVQELLKANSEGRTGKHYQNSALLTGLLFDDKGNRMTPSFTVKRGIRYGSYVSSALLKGRKSGAGSKARIPSDVMESAVTQVLRERFPDLAGLPVANQAAIGRLISRVVLGNADIRIQFKPDADAVVPEIRLPRPAGPPNKTVRIDDPTTANRESNPQLLQALVRAHSWVSMLAEGEHESLESLGKAVGLHPKVIRSAIRLAFLDPKTTKAILLGEYVVGSLRSYVGPIPISWLEQQVALLKKQSSRVGNPRRMGGVPPFSSRLPT